MLPCLAADGAHYDCVDAGAILLGKPFGIVKPMDALVIVAPAFPAATAKQVGFGRFEYRA